MSSDIFLGIDPGLVKTGWGVIEKSGYCIKYVDCGVIHTKSDDIMENRLVVIYDFVVDLINRFSPKRVSMEQVFVNINPKTSQKLIMARTAAFLALSKCGYKVDEYTPNEIKKNITGKGHSSKNQIYVMVKKILGIDIVVDSKSLTSDAIDAIAIALCNTFSC